MISERVGDDGKKDSDVFPIVTNSLTYRSALYYRQGSYDLAWVCWLLFF